MHNNIVIIINTKQLQYTNVCYKNMLNKINQTVKKNVLWSKVFLETYCAKKNIYIFIMFYVAVKC
jgi:hypothetical protein